MLHYTAMPDATAALERLCDPTAEVSAHWLIGRCGTAHPLVDEDRRAWHAGAGRWGAITDVNSASIGIELDNDGVSPFPDRQIKALESLLDAIMGRWSIPPQGVIGHSDMAPGRKADPGARFDWKRLADAGRGVWPRGTACGDGPFGESAAKIGYPVGDVDPTAILAAFRMRFRPGASGPEDATDRRLAADLADGYPAAIAD